MQSSSNLPSYEQKNCNDTNQSEATKLDSLSEQDKQMVEKYQSQIKDGTLTIQENPDLKSLDFMKFLVIHKLELSCCKNIIPKLESQTINWLELTNCEIQSVKDFQLDNLEVLKLFNMKNKLESKTLMFEIAIFQKMKELSLYRYITDFSTLSQMVGLTKLILIQCELQSTEVLRSLINLEELNLSENEEIDITTLQYLTNLTRLTLQSCNLVNLDALRPLKKLEELEIYYNNIVYFQPLTELKQLLKVDASYNNAIDTESIRLHPNFDNFLLSVKKLPTEEELKTANIMRDINSPITSLKQLQLLSNRVKEKNIVFKQKITQQVQNSYYTHEQFVVRTAIVFQKMNVFDGCQ
ncbi:leucine-rich_repeat domain-containing protein [Hexamita inflata]|uniref:Leucine-rich_repeat domain-containing protein n=1 Tax=Hexamita inflata TaxID=28002 RepID=A0ABP1HJT9_9EUKA